MNNTFSIPRFSRLLNKHTKEHYRTYLMSAAVLVGILSLTLGFVAYQSRGRLSVQVQGVSFALFLLLSGAIFTSMIFSDLGSKTKSIPALTLPVSHFERFLVGWVYSFIVFQLVFVLCFFSIDLIIIHIGNHNPAVQNKLIDVWSDDSKFYTAFLVFGLLHAVTFLGAIFFEKLHFIKTAFVFFIFLIGITLIDQPLVRLIFNTDTHNSSPFGGIEIQEQSRSFYIQPTGPAITVLISMVFLVMVLLWTAAFFRLKEKQV